ncbi:hypothetical protein [Xanthocytophaga agilis]|uniref:Uncharacterized protein n=1 Tax=Xanthocytophaga agilis TaxID=3048010 RepID=A0AAE3R3Q2_9BACT|nr:hypothetical protein [Xanthocytophaga agilis]MDJ1502595.1 hypothetical protein [Xanthocytophaga agilis]
MFQPYEEILKRKPDFRVTYQFYSPEEGGRLRLPIQGLRFNFWYESELHTEPSIFMIWPEFEDRNQKVILEGEVYKEGIARMWIINPVTIPYHKERLQVGSHGYFMEGRRRVAECDVIELIGLKE